MTAFEKNLKIKSNILDQMRECEFFKDSIQVDDFQFAIPTTVDGETRYCVVALVAKSNKATKTTAAFNPVEAHEEYLEEAKRKLAAELAKSAKKSAKK